MIIRPRKLIIGAALLCSSLAPALAQERIRVAYDDGRAAEDVSVYHLSDEGQVRFLRASDVARLLRATQFWNASSRKAVLGVGRSRFVLTVDTRVVVVDGEPVLLRAPIRYDAGFVMIPMEFVLEVASQYTPRVFIWEEGSRTLRVEGVGYNVGGITFGAAANRTTATIDLTEPLLYHMDANTPGLVRLKLYGGRVDPRTVALRERRGLIEGVRAEQSERDAYLYFDVARSVRRVRIDRNESPHQVVLVLEKGDLPEIPEPEFEGQEVVEIVDESTAERRSLRIEKVCIDPGHGGQDHGKASPSGLLEKDVTLALAREMKRRFEDELGLEVVLTRDDDRLLS
ncbi:MAG: N-acetylmuramoyl-L-alanine amidase, partial [Candidatus Krumholzibacteria bacterium]|nr:N-acetylmuramoyl-L-alanine amidase [Candidatus Krumholzibacteria bacterium]